uniref:Uncharacterized protein n=1 Tax=Anopheles maculatus TaxID=74869 RepID=A0A182TBV4_9DIPT
MSKKSVRSTQCRFLLSKCAFDLKKYSEAENALINDDHLRPRHLDEIVKEFGDIACFALELVSKICLKTERSKLANEASRRAIKLNPFLWQSFADLCSRGEKPDPDSVFQLTSTDIFQTSQAHHYNSIVWFGGTGGYHNGPLLDSSVGVNDCTADQMGDSADNPSTPVDQCFTQNINTPNNQHPPGAPPGLGHVPQQQQNLNYSYFNSSVGSIRLGGANVSAGDQTPTANVFTEHNNTPFRKQQFKYLSTISPSTPSFGVLPIVHTPNEPIANKKMRRHHHNNLGTMGNIINRKHESPHHPQQAAIQLLQQQSTNTKPIVFSQTGNQLTTTPRTPNTTGGALQHGQNVRRSSRLFSNSNSVKENAKSPQLNNKFVAPRSPPRRTKQRISKTINNSVTTLLENIPEKKSS